MVPLAGLNSRRETDHWSAQRPLSGGDYDYASAPVSTSPKGCWMES